ncbi:Serine/threonine-protein kinase PrkC [Rosistilla carotiformis]|uniref:Serine/threonine-protein kinase PrkC n=1 Tax=Rosistilla carotiformis TaxID=2528017 RepID=A0A518K0L3_9BACT|nr:serine/threonine-protein kinase [Rosistilla carotiformis]QDV71339.1 Serine/threonine-protein kinase PrkC [Rosistilla carotiformis]
MSLGNITQRARVALTTILTQVDDVSATNADLPVISPSNDAISQVLSEYQEETDDDQLDLLTDLIIQDMKLGWRSGCRKDLESYLVTWPQLLEHAINMQRMLAAEVTFRAAFAEPIDLESVNQRFPDFAFDKVEFERLLQSGRSLGSEESYQRTGRFFLLREIGSGGMGVVYMAFDRQRRQRVALKVLPTASSRALHYFKREFRSLSDLVHPNLVVLYELFAEANSWFYTMELIDGRDLWKHLGASKFLPLNCALVSTDSVNQTKSEPSSTQGQVLPQPRFPKENVAPTPPAPARPPLDYAMLRRLFAQIADGVVALHATRKLHRDLKPSNIVVRGDGSLVIVDFGLAIALDAADELQPDASGTRPRIASANEVSDLHAAGTVPYMSPEQTRSDKLTPASDWFSVGVMLCEALSGQTLFRGLRAVVLQHKREAYAVPEIQFPEDVPEDLIQLGLAMLSSDPDARPDGSKIQAVLSGKDVQPGTDAAEIPAQRPFVGRSDDLAKLGNGLQWMLQGNAVVAHVQGNSGSGKSRLINYFLEHTQLDAEACILSGRCYEGESVPFKAIDALIDALCRYLNRLPEHQVDALLPKNIATLSRIFPALNGVPSIARSTQHNAFKLEAQEQRRIAFAAFRKLLDAIGKKCPLVLHVDDLHWCDLDSATTLTELVAAPNPPRLMLLMGYRNERVEHNPCLRMLREVGDAKHRISIHVSALSREESLQLATELMPRGISDAASIAETIVRESQGIPFFISELAQSLDNTSTRIEADLDQVLFQRIARLPEQARTLLEIISVAAQPVRTRVALQSSGLDSSRESLLGLLRSERLIRTTGRDIGDDVCAYHDRIREAVVGKLPAQDRIGHHLRLAEALRQEFDADPERIGNHFEAAGQPAQAGSYYGVAADLAADKLAFNRAVRLYQSSIALQDLSPAEARPIGIRLADALANAGRGAEAAQQYQAAIDPTDTDEALQLERKAAYQYCISGHIPEGRAALASVLQQNGMRLSKSPQRALLSMLSQQALLRIRGLKFRTRNEDQIDPAELTQIDVAWAASAGLSMFDVVEGASFQTRNLRMALRVGERTRLARALAWEAAHVSNAGGHTQGRVNKLLGLAKQLASGSDEPYVHVITALSDGVQHWTNGRWQKSFDALIDAEHRLRNECAGVAWELDTAHTFILWGQFYLGQLDELCTRSDAWMTQAKQRGDLYAETTHGSFSVAMAKLVHDDPAAGRMAIDDALNKWVYPGFHVQHSIALMANTYIDLYCGNGIDAWNRYQKQWPQLKASNLLHLQTIRMFNLQLRGRAILAAVMQPSNRFAWNQANAMLARVERDASKIIRSKMPYCIPHGKHLLAGVAAARGHREAVGRLLEEAERGYSSVDMRMFAAATRWRRGQLIGGTQGDDLIRTAQQTMQAQKVRNPAAFCDALAVRVT